jgi:O-antigen ligase
VWPEHGSARVDLVVRSKAFYLLLVLVVTLMVAAISFYRVRADGLQNVALWLFAGAFLATLIKDSWGLLTTLFLLAVGPSLHLQINALLGMQLKGWAYPGVDASVGFLAAWLSKGGHRSLRLTAERFPSGPLVLLHAWVAISCSIVVVRNLWQSGSEFSVRGLLYNTALIRGISWHDDYYPLQDLFFCSVALLMLFAAWTMLLRQGRDLSTRLVLVFLAGAAVNAIFGLWQRATELGWILDRASLSPNAFFPDQHSFAALMAIALLLGLGLFTTQKLTNPVRFALLLILATVGVALFRSHSRAILIFVVLAFTAFGFGVALRSRGWRRVVAIAGLAAVGIAVHWALTNGYRGLTYEFFSALASDPERINPFVGRRPEIWSAAVRMFADFPFFGLGQAQFYRLSAIPEFSKSELLVSMGGENAHSYVLQFLVELGPVGAGLIALSCLPAVRLGQGNLLAISSYALVGVAIGNVYAHALLIREMLMIFAVLVAMHYWEAEQLRGDATRGLSGAVRRPMLAALVLASAFAIVDGIRSFQRFPFTFGQKCLEAKSLSSDGWASGTFRRSIPGASRRVEVDLSWERPDVGWRSVSILASILTDGEVLERVQVQAADANEPPYTIRLPLSPAGASTRELLIESSNCYVPLNFGVTYDPRRLGFKLRAVRFIGTDGSVIESQ